MSLDKRDNIPLTVETMLKSENIQRAVDKDLIVA